MLRHARLRDQETGIRLEDGHEATGELEAWHPLAKIGGRQHFVYQSVFTDRQQRTLEDTVARPAHVQAASDEQELLTGTLLQLAPQLVRAAQEGHVGRVLVVGEAN